MEGKSPLISGANRLRIKLSAPEPLACRANFPEGSQLVLSKAETEAAILKLDPCLDSSMVLDFREGSSKISAVMLDENGQESADLLNLVQEMGSLSFVGEKASWTDVAN